MMIRVTWNQLGKEKLLLGAPLGKDQRAALLNAIRIIWEVRSRPHSIRPSGLGFSINAPHQTIQTIIKASTPTAIATWARRITAFAAGSMALAAQRPEAMRIRIRTTLTE